VRSYASSFDDNGSWQYQASYGYVWYPRAAVGWRPYYYGRWHHLRPYGWTWVGSDPWAWPTHHYGRWGFSAGAWFWIPGKHWGPAWVSWGYAPGYVSWCPLGWNNLPVYGFSTAHYRPYRYGPWHAWTVVPHGRFGHGYVNINVVNVNNLDVRTRTAFTERRTPPEIRGYAIPRADAPIRLAGSRAVSSTGTAAPAAQLSSPGVRGREITRERGSVSTQSERRGFPAPARAPRSSAVTQSGERAQPRSGGSIRTQPQPAERPAPSAGGSGGSVRAAPRGGSTQGQAPASGGTTSAPAPGSAPAVATPSTRPRAVPRSGGGGESYTPSYGAYRQTPPSSGTPSTTSPYRSARPAPGNREAVVPYAVPDRSIRRPPTAPQSDAPPPSYGPRPRMDAPARMDAPRGYGPPPSRSERAGSPAPGPGSAPRAAQPRGGSEGSASAPSRGSGGGTAARGTARSRGGE
jgi:hypothetical protein